MKNFLKDHHKTIVSVAVIIIVGVALVILFAWNKRHAEAPVRPDGANTAQGDDSTGSTSSLVTIAPRMVPVDEDSYLFGIGGSYPQFSQADDAFNAKIASTFTNDIAEFKKTVNADYQAHLQTDPDFQKNFTKGDYYSYQIKATVVQSNSHFISVAIHYGGFSGGAHGSENVATFNYDVKSGAEISTLEYFFPGDLAYMKKVSDQARAQLTAKIAKAASPSPLDANLKSMIIDGTQPNDPANFKNFTFTNGSVKIYFPAYQVAPYVFGEQTVTIPR